MSLEPKKTGGPIQKFWDSPEIVTSLESVKGWLSKNAKKVRFALSTRFENPNNYGRIFKRRESHDNLDNDESLNVV